MTWNFEKVAGPYKGSCGGLAWDGESMLFSAVEESRVLRFSPATGQTEVFRRFTNRVNGLAFGPNHELFAGQEGSRRILEFLPDGSAAVHAYHLDGKLHNHPSDLVVDKVGRIWFADPYHAVATPGVQIFPPLDHASVLRLECDLRRTALRGTWSIQRVTHDTAAPRAVLLSPDEKTLYVAEGDTRQPTRELRAYPVREDRSVGAYSVLHTFGSDHRGAHRGIEGMCLDGDGNIVACAGWAQSGPGPLVYVFSPQGAVIATHAFPGGMPVRCAFGGQDEGGDRKSLYVTTADGFLYRARTSDRQGDKS